MLKGRHGASIYVEVWICKEAYNASIAAQRRSRDAAARMPAADLF